VSKESIKSDDKGNDKPLTRMVHQWQCVTWMFGFVIALVGILILQSLGPSQLNTNLLPIFYLVIFFVSVIGAFGIKKIFFNSFKVRHSLLFMAIGALLIIPAFLDLSSGHATYGGTLMVIAFVPIFFGVCTFDKTSDW